MRHIGISGQAVDWLCTRPDCACADVMPAGYAGKFAYQRKTLPF
jgi:hypothetical protein